MIVLCTTAQGKAALAAAMLGEQLLFTKAVIGAGYIPDNTVVQTISDVIEVIDTRPIISIVHGRSEGTAVVSFTLDNVGRNDGYYLREIGIYAYTESTGEVLFTYCNAGSEAEYIQPEGGAKATEKKISVINTVSDAANVTALIDSSMYATIDMVNKAINTAGEALIAANEALDREIKCPVGGCDALAALSAKVKQLENVLYSIINNSGMNDFNISFDTLENKTITAGIWNEAAARLEC